MSSDISTLEAEPRRALLIRFSSLGDVILTQPAARSLKAALGGGEVTLLTRAAFRPLLEGQPGIDRVLALEDAPRGAGGLARFVHGLGFFEIAIDLHRTARSGLCLRSVRAGRRLAYRKDAFLRRLWAWGWMRERMAAERRHVVDRYLEPLRRLGLETPYARPEIVLAPAEVDAARGALGAAGVRDVSRVAVIVPGARWPNKRWTAEGFAAVAVRLRAEDGLEPVLAGEGAEIPETEAVSRLVPGGAVSVAGRTGIRELAALLAAARVVVANDSGPAHLAAAVGTPVVAIFGPTVEAFGFAPRGEHVRVVSRDLPCRPCTVHGGRRCPRGRRACLDDLPAAVVLAAVRELLAAVGEAPARAGMRGV